MRVAIVGAGAVGLGIASCLGPAGARVHIIARSESSEQAIRVHGVVRRGIFGDAHVPASALRVGRSLDALAEAALDYVLVCTKTVSTPEIAAALGRVWPALRGDPRLVVCQNGWGNAERFADALPAERVFSARVITGFRRHALNEVEITVHADAIHMGSLFDQDPSALEPLCEAIAAGGIPCALSREIERDLWAKVLYNCLLNPLGALVRVPYGVLGSRDETREIMAQVACEIFAVLRESGHQTHWTSATDYLEEFYANLLPPTAAHESSMLQDLEAGRPTEIDALCGAVVELASRHGVSVPTNDALLQLVRAAR